MIIEILAIGEEVLKGKILNSNSSFLSSYLLKLGWKVSRHTVLPDEASALKAGIQEALLRSDIVIATGGLGPTLDDITRRVAADIFDSGFRFDEATALDLEQRFGTSLESLIDQATVPSKAILLKNTVGTAPGFLFRDKQKSLVLLPGPPLEMEPMFIYEAIPLLKKQILDHSSVFVETLYFCLLGENLLDPLLREMRIKFPSVDIGIYPGYGTLAVVLEGSIEKEVKAVKDQIQQAFIDYSYTSDTGKIEEALLNIMKQKQVTLCVAESCTGGLLSHKITALPGASEVFLGSMVTYSNELKKNILQVSSSTLSIHGAVSEQAVAEMLRGIFKISSADYGIAVSGIAGPSGGSALKPVGTVWYGIAKRGTPPQIGKMLLKGNRQTILYSATTRLFSMLFRNIKFGAHFQKM